MSKEQDMDVIDFGVSISKLSVDTPIAIEFDIKYFQKDIVWWHNQREHLWVWCFMQPTKGLPGYKRENPNHSTRTMYNKFGNPGGLIWLAEALGEDTKILNEAISEALKVEPSRARCSKIREIIPFDRILELIGDKVVNVKSKGNIPSDEVFNLIKTRIALGLNAPELFLEDVF